MQARLTGALAQVNLKVNHCLLVLPGVKREDIQRVMSHPQARHVRRCFLTVEYH